MNVIDSDGNYVGGDNEDYEIYWTEEDSFEMEWFVDDCTKKMGWIVRRLSIFHLLFMKLMTMATLIMRIILLNLIFLSMKPRLLLRSYSN